MWKCASRTIKTIVAKDFLRCNTVLSTKAPQDKSFRSLLKFSPALIEQFSRFYGHYKASCGKFSEEKKGREGPREERTSFLGSFNCHVFDAITWCGAFALGYYFLQPFKHTGISGFNSYENNGCPMVSGYQKTVEYLIDSVKIKPFNNILPEVKATKNRKIKEEVLFPESAESSSTKSDNDDFIALEKAHHYVLGGVNNLIGAQFMKSGKHKEALKYFKRAAEEENAAGIFNLGICYERGLGTDQNFKRAAELYRKASELGHATAMYNLAVFHIQGLGGVKPDVDHARELFIAAANLGQADAEKALNLEKQTLGEVPENIVVSPEKKGETSASSLICDNLLHQTSSVHFVGNCKMCGVKVKNDGCDSFVYLDDKEVNSTIDCDSGVLDLSPHNESEILPA